MKIKAIIFVYTSFCLANEFLNKAALNGNHLFVLVAVGQDDKKEVTTFELNNLLKSHFPVGPLRYNKVLSTRSINDDKLKEIEANSWQLASLCIEDQMQESKIKCGFESLEQANLAYVFALPKEVKEINGYVILKTIYKSILEQSIRNISEIELHNLGIDPEEEYWQDEPPILEPEQPTTLIDKVYMNMSTNHIVVKSAIWTLMKYTEVKQWIKSWIK